MQRQKISSNQKAFKLYLNSFNQTRFENWHIVEETLLKDLTACAKGRGASNALPTFPFYLHSPIVDFVGECIDNQPIEIDNYQFDSQWLKRINNRYTG